MKKIYSILEKQLIKQGIQEFEVFWERREQRTYQAKDGQLDSAEEKVHLGMSLRIFREKKFSHAFSSDLSEAGIRRLVEDAVQILPLVDSDPDFGLPPMQPAIPQVDLKNYDSSLPKRSPSEKIKLAVQLEQSAISVDPRIKHVRSAHYSEEVVEQSLWNSHGFDQTQRRSECSLALLAVAEADDDAESGFDFSQNCFFEGLDPETVGRSAARRALDYLGSQTPPSGKYAVVLDPLVSGEFLEKLSQSFQGDEIYRKRSRLTDQLGKKLYSEKLNLIDDSLLPGGLVSSAFDGEGQPGRRLSLIEAGVIKNFLLDTYFGRKLGMPGNGSSWRSGPRKPPMVGPSNLYLPAGSLPDDEIFREVGEGIWVTDVIGMHAADPITGDFSVGAQGFLISKGRVSYPLKKMALAGNLHKIFSALKWVGSHHRFYDNIGAPTLGFPEISISGN